MRSGSLDAWVERVDINRVRKWGFSVKVDGVGGMAVVVPIASFWEGGTVGR